MLFRQVITYHLRPDHSHAVGNANRCLQVPFAGMPGGLFDQVHGEHLRVDAPMLRPARH
jgi:hypothetical protein